MSDSLGTTQMHLWVNRIHKGDLAARDDLLRSICGRMERLARKMLREYPGVERFAETSDVLQNALLRLMRSLEQIRPASMREFFGLCALQIRRELLDLARRYKGPAGPDRHEVGLGSDADVLFMAADAHDPTEDTDFAQWCAFHEAVDELPPEEREVVGLIFYHGWSQAEVAALFQVTERSVRRWWQSARLQLHARLKPQANDDSNRPLPHSESL